MKAEWYEKQIRELLDDVEADRSLPLEEVIGLFEELAGDLEIRIEALKEGLEEKD